MPTWKHVYHMLHSLDLWFMNPRDKDYQEPPFHIPDLNNLDVPSEKGLARAELTGYYAEVQIKILQYLQGLQDQDLIEKPPGCEYTRFTLILAQIRHLHTHMGMIMGFIVEATGLWPLVVGLEGSLPTGSAISY